MDSKLVKYAFVALATKRKPAAPTSESKTLETVHQMRQDDDVVYRSINNICRGC